MRFIDTERNELNGEDFPNSDWNISIHEDGSLVLGVPMFLKNFKDEVIYNGGGVLEVNFLDVLKEASDNYGHKKLCLILRYYADYLDVQ